MRTPVLCHRCSSGDIKAHCQSPSCTWMVCRTCRAVSAFVLGEAKFMGGV